MKLMHLLDKFLDGAGKRRSILLSFDICCYGLVAVCYYFLAQRAANSMPVEDGVLFLLHTGLQLALMVTIRMMCGTYQNVWRYSNTRAYFVMVMADAAAALLTVVSLRIANEFVDGIYQGLWQAVSLGSLTALLSLVSRFGYTMLYKESKKKKTTTPRVPVVIVGAGRLGRYLAGDLSNNPNSGFDPMFFVDTDRTKIGNRVSGLKVYDTEAAENLIKTLGIRDVIIAIADKEGDEMAEVYYRYRDLGCKVRIYESLVDDETQKGVLREFSIEDLLMRPTHEVGGESMNRFYRDKTVLVTGGGGSIGSELCRQIARFSPKKLVIFDIYENNAYEIQQELLRNLGGDFPLFVEIGSVRDAARLDELFRKYRPQIVFHAAAHKHVPLMENSSAEAIKNNCLGTYNTANAAEKYGAERFILISTDKAVNPTNIMGASKRVCEMIIQSRRDSATTFAAVRFGNVLGSNGSVIPLFKRQIAEGGPVTITDKRIIRYFMTIPEASRLVLHAGVMAQKGELFVLDMGKPVKIYDLAVNMIRLSGLEPDVDIEVQEIGLRPGEKLYEELLIRTEQLTKTENDMIFVERDEPLSREQVEQKLKILSDAVAAGEGVREAIAAVVPTFRNPAEVNREADSSAEMQAARS